ncbi:radical SAM/SPASM domain-containing protein [Burkholderia multivorans]|uniref:radical SAM/SPASM domain-containing protein n=1 Tax=Burkholderia multivorans TaxID=87883 RepID=UPI002019DC3F|nr:radical SAM protein [Burkholderia multivorans]MCL4652472.1 radical SAM protein [Burkholderia multivorans]MCL4654299.1 radical SAM protein [Burkholderia multivorans]MCO1426980.1 radical SAM protein [Burkholderia multivorans]UQN53373.1 radical SAM protein [Burkholderia multivorans]UQN82282.1 radical SAM protein [Burkholderia multivorans]
MAQFVITAIDPRPGQGDAQVRLHYDNMASTLTFEDGRSVVPRIQAQRDYPDAVPVSAEEPGRKGPTIRMLKIQLGHACNYECSYCNQAHIARTVEQTGPQDVPAFIDLLRSTLSAPPERVEFWGGEPLVYIKTLRPLIDAIRALYPAARLSMVTNGALLTPEINAWIDEAGLSIGLSHDGPGYHARGRDPLDVPDKRASIMDLYARLHPKGRISINAMMHRDNPSRAAVQAWLQGRFGEDVPIGEGSFIDPYDEGGLAATLHDDEHATYRLRAFAELRAGAAKNFGMAAQKIKGFVDSLRFGRPASAIGQKCGMDQADRIAVDLRGNVLTCQNASAVATAPNGQPHKIGHLSDLAGVAMRTSTHWSRRPDCANCPVLHLCGGSCMFLEGRLWEAGCDAAFSDNVPFFAASIEFMTGLIPIYIEGDLREDRKDIFGQVRGAPAAPKKRVIPIMADDRPVDAESPL